MYRQHDCVLWGGGVSLEDIRNIITNLIIKIRIHLCFVTCSINFKLKAIILSVQYGVLYV